jgi:predicted nuclease with RNAse H fold
MANELYIGVDPTAGKRPFRLVALDDDLRIASRLTGSVEEVLEFLGSLERAVVAVDAPASLNGGWMRRADVRRRLGLPERTRRWSDWRVCEAELRLRNLRLYNTPSTRKAAPAWMRVGFDFYRRLEALGFVALTTRGQEDLRLHIEVHPHACYAALLARRPMGKSSLEGRMQRQMALYLEGVDVPNPMDVFEGITRQTILRGPWPLESLEGHDELDALAGAFTAFVARQRPGHVTQVGVVEEGLITLPSDELLDHYA